jgi:predicted ATPase
VLALQLRLSWPISVMVKMSCLRPEPPTHRAISARLLQTTRSLRESNYDGYPIDSRRSPSLVTDGGIMPGRPDPLRGMLRAGEFEPYIRHIRFPHFRNLRDSLEIEFTYPITALVGPNGTNKTAILRALQGCPDYYNVGQYWFSTSLDPISPQERHRFIHGYLAKSEGKVVEVIKTRIARADRTDKGDDNPDYFEPSRPLLRDGMERPPPLPEGVTRTEDRTATRWTAIRKEVVYVDFRAQLSAFDKYFYHIPFEGRVQTLTDKKKFIRRRSTHLAKALNQHSSAYSLYSRERIIEPAAELSNEQVGAVSSILGRRYQSIQIIRHYFFGFDGYSVILQSSNHQYSEAFAGSGEFAAVMLVRAVTEAPDHSLILLDEPEVSLHPGAQRQLMAFLREQAKANRHQFVISTHAPGTINDLPNDAIKIFQADPIDGKIDLVGQSSDPAEAFFRLGVPSDTSYQIYVEDDLAAALVRKSIRPLGEALNRQTVISKVPGGAGSIHNLIPSFAALGQSYLVLLDGDQRVDLPESAQSVADTDLPETASRLLHGAPRLLLDGGNDPDREANKSAKLRQVIDWMIGHVSYLPGSDPESLVLSLTGEERQFTSSEAKQEWERRTRVAMGRADWEDVPSAQILGEAERALKDVPEGTQELSEIRERIVTFIESARKDD